MWVLSDHIACVFLGQYLSYDFLCASGSADSSTQFNELRGLCAYHLDYENDEISDLLLCSPANKSLDYRSVSIMFVVLSVGYALSDNLPMLIAQNSSMK